MTSTMGGMPISSPSNEPVADIAAGLDAQPRGKIDQTRRGAGLQDHVDLEIFAPIEGNGSPHRARAQNAAREREVDRGRAGRQILQRDRIATRRGGHGEI